MSKITGFRSAWLHSCAANRSAIFRHLSLALAAGTALAAFQPGAAMAQFWGGGSWYGGWAPAYPRAYPAYPRAYPAYPRGLDEEQLRPGDISDLIRGRGWVLLSAMTRSGGRYQANVRNAYGQRLFVVIDAYDGRVLRTSVIEDRPDTRSLAAIPGEGENAGPGIRPVLPGQGSVTPAPKPARRAPSLVKRVAPPPAVKSAPIGPAPGTSPDDKDGSVAVAKPTIEPPAVKPVMPLPASPAPTGPEAIGTPSGPASPDAGAAKPAIAPPAAKPARAAKGGKASEPGLPEPAHPAPAVRQIYPSAEGQGAAPAPAPQSAAAAAPAPAPAAPAPAPAAPAAPSAEPAKVPAKTPAKPELPADAGFE